MAFWLADVNVKNMMEGIKDEHHPHLAGSNIAILFSDKRKVSGNRITLGTAKRVSPEDKVLSKYDFKIVLSAEDWADLTDVEKRVLLDHELSHCDVAREPATEVCGAKKIPLKDSYGRTIYTDKIKFDDAGNPKWKIRPHDLENFAHIVERYGIELATKIGGFFPQEPVAGEDMPEDDTPQDTHGR